ncbi:hypothetical protein [Flavobacterium sp.]|uniref:hypothetical protein n=1 Tax=Flavobacterium sp. TaxID=239 RepID=UPI0025BD0DAB|nr:hypothetical protein [Flavobacterium sp.]
MKKYITLAFLCVYLFSMTEVHQLLKMPLLVEHYLEHKQENKQLSLLSFFEMHYLNGQHLDSDHDKDMQLPFKNFQDNHPNVVLALPESVEFIPPYVFPQDVMVLNFNEHQIFISNFLTSIWQPPKIA